MFNILAAILAAFFIIAKVLGLISMSWLAVGLTVFGIFVTLFIAYVLLYLLGVILYIKSGGKI